EQMIDTLDLLKTTLLTQVDLFKTVLDANVFLAQSMEGLLEESTEKIISQNTSTPLISCQTLLSDLQEIQALSSFSKMPLFSVQKASKAYTLSCNYQKTLQLVMQRLIRHLKQPLTPSLIAVHVIDLIIHGTGCIEQSLTAKMLQDKQFKTKEKVKQALTHNLLILYNACTFIERPLPADFSLIKDTNLLDIVSRNIPLRLADNENPKGAFKLLTDSYLLVQGEAAVKPAKLLKEAAKYFEKVLSFRMRFERLFSEDDNSDQNALEMALKKFSKNFQAGYQNLHLEEKPDFSDLFFNAPLKQICQLEERCRKLKEKATRVFEMQNFGNFFFLLERLKAELSAFSSDHPEELELLYFHVLQLNRLIVAECFYDLLESHGQILDRHGKSKTLKELASLAFFKTHISSEQEFLKEEREAFFMTRYGTTSRNAETSEMAAAMKKSTSASKKAESIRSALHVDDDFQLVANKKSLADFKKATDFLVSDIRTTCQLAEKIMSLVSF
ncbi:MAG: hypothetical protein ACM3JI_02880, partial [Anaerolineae bacterium]